MDAIFELIRNFKRTKFEDLPKEAVDMAKNEVLDSLATALGGAAQPGVPELVSIVKEWGGKKQSTIIAYGVKCPAPNAAQVNSTMIHALDFDDGNPAALVHTGCVAVSTCFAAAERMGTISGKEFITALALGSDLMSRLSLATRPGTNLLNAGWHPTTLNGFLAAAAMAGRVMNLDENKMINALGIAYHQCAGNLQAVKDGALTKRMGPGLASRGGLLAALMAERGITGARDSLEGKNGLFNLYHGGDYDPKTLVRDLGKRFEGVNMGFKPYPCCGLTHPFIDAAISLKAKYNIQPQDVESVTAAGGDAAYSLCVPPEVKNNPRNTVDAQFSVPWTIAVALINGKVGTADFTEDAIKRDDILKIAQKVIGQLDPKMNRHGVGPGRVVVKMKDGLEYSAEIEHALGSVQKPMAFNDLAAKFKECASRSLKQARSARINRVIEMIRQLDNLEDATEVIRLVG
ncbi:MAG: PrpD [Chloroflexi bacterium]|nr:PrpD [Chloroflexota bacterium]